MAFGVFRLSLLLAITAFGGPDGHVSLAIIAFEAFEFIAPKCYYRLGKWNLRSLASLFKEVTVFPGNKAREVLKNFGETKLSTSTIAALFSKMAEAGQRIAMVDMVVLVFTASPHLP